MPSAPRTAPRCVRGALLARPTAAISWIAAVTCAGLGGHLLGRGRVLLDHRADRLHRVGHTRAPPAHLLRGRRRSRSPGAPCPRRRVRISLERLTRLVGLAPSPSSTRRCAALHRRDGLAGAVLDLGDQLGDLLGLAPTSARPACAPRRRRPRSPCRARPRGRLRSPRSAPAGWSARRCRRSSRPPRRSAGRACPARATLLGRLARRRWISAIAGGRLAHRLAAVLGGVRSAGWPRPPASRWRRPARRPRPSGSRWRWWSGPGAPGRWRRARCRR